jgi:hypothetical protein
VLLVTAFVALSNLASTAVSVEPGPSGPLPREMPPSSAPARAVLPAATGPRAEPSTSARQEQPVASSPKPDTAVVAPAVSAPPKPEPTLAAGAATAPKEPADEPRAEPAAPTLASPPASPATPAAASARQTSPAITAVDPMQVSTQVHPMVLAHPDHNVVVCEAGCSGKPGSVVHFKRKVATNPLTSIDQAAAAQKVSVTTTPATGASEREPAIVTCLAGCYDATPKIYPARRGVALAPSQADAIRPWQLKPEPGRTPGGEIDSTPARRPGGGTNDRRAGTARPPFTY